MTLPAKLTGWAADLSSETQSRRAKQNRGKTPWRCGPICHTKKAQAKFDADNRKIDRRVSRKPDPSNPPA